MTRSGSRGSGDTGASGVLRNAEQRRLRTPWRLVVGAVVVVLVGAGGTALQSALWALVEDGTDPFPTAVVGTAGRVVTLAALTAGILAASRLVDRRPFTDLGLDRSRAWWTDLATGLALGVGLPALVFALELAAGYVRVTGTLVSRADASLPVAPGVPPLAALALVFAYFVAVGVSEELLFRGYLLANVAEGLAWFGLSTRAALAGAGAVTSLLFGLGHAANPAATLRSTAIVACYGGFFAASVLLTGRIAVAVGLHIAWNFTVSSVFGFPVSGFTTPVTVLAVDQSGPALVTGGEFGPEGGLVALVGLAVGVAALAWWVRRDAGGRRSGGGPDSGAWSWLHPAAASVYLRGEYPVDGAGAVAGESDDENEETAAIANGGGENDG